jgi:PKD repeat protein
MWRYGRRAAVLGAIAVLALVLSGCFLDFPPVRPSVAEFTWTVPPSTTAPREVQFDASASHTGGALAITEYIWDWNGDFIPDWEADGPITAAQFQPGTYPVRLVGNSPDSYSFPAQHDVVVPPPDAAPTPPSVLTVRLRPLPDPLCANQPILFDASDTTLPEDDKIDVVEWDLGGGKFDVDTRNTPALTYVFPQAGSFQVRARVTTASGAVGEVKLPVSVSDCGRSALRTAGAAASRKSFTATFTSGGKAPPMSRLLDFVNSRVLRGQMRTGLFPGQAGELSSAVPSLNGPVAARLHARKSGSGFVGTGVAAVRPTGGRAGWTCLRLRLHTSGVAVTGTFRTIGGTGPLADQRVRGELDAKLSSQAPIAGGKTSVSAGRSRTPPECAALARRLGAK